MDYVQADWADTPVSRIALGCEILGGSDWGVVDLDEAVAGVRAALEAGITVFDTADAYGLGRSEEVLSEALGARRAEVLIVTKGGVAWQKPADGGRAKTYKSLHPEYLRAAVHESLRRLAVERIPLYLAHWPDGVTAAEDVVDTLAGLRDDGLIGAFGLSNFPAVDLELPRVLSRLHAVEAEHSLVAPNDDVLRLAGDRGVLRFTYGALAQGLLSGKYSATHEFGPDDRRHRLEVFGAGRGAYESLLTNLDLVAAETGWTQAQIAARWVLDSGLSDSVIVGARNSTQALASVEVSDLALTEEMINMLEQPSMQENVAGENQS